MFVRLLLLLSALVWIAAAQEYRATILGQVTDPSGAAIPNATVKATNEATNVSRETVTTAAGLYAFRRRSSGFPRTWEAELILTWQSSHPGPVRPLPASSA